MATVISNPNKDFPTAMESYNSAYQQYKVAQDVTSKNALIDSHTRLTNTLDSYIGNLNANTKYDENTYAEIITEYNAIRTKRSDLDMKLREIYDLQDTIPRENKQMFDSTMLSVTLCAVLASSVVYFIFSK